MKKKQPPLRKPGETSAAWFVVPLSIASAVLIAMGDQPMDLPFPPASRQAAPAPLPVAPSVQQPERPRGQGAGHAKAV